jgi:hypothetical protein
MGLKEAMLLARSNREPHRRGIDRVMETLRVQRDAVEEMWGRLADIAAGTFQRCGTCEMSKVPDGFQTVSLACIGRP